MRTTPRWLALVASLTLSIAGACTTPTRSGTDAPAARTSAVDPALRGGETFDEAWRLVRDTHFDVARFDPAQGGLDWDAVRDELRPRAEFATSADEVRGAIQEMLGRLGESHFAVLPAEREPSPAAAGAPAPQVSAAGAAVATTPAPSEPAPDEADASLGIDVRVVDDVALVSAVERDTPAAALGVQPGWVIEKIGLVDIADSMREIPTSLSPSWRAFLQSRVVGELLEGRSGELRVLRLRDGSDNVVEMEARLAVPPGEVVRLGTLPPFRTHLDARTITPEELAAAGMAANGTAPPRIALIAFNIWMVPVAMPFHQAIDRFRDADGLIIDLRGNPGGLGAMAMGLAGHFCDTPLSLGTLRTRDTTFEFLVNPRRTSMSGERVEPFAGPVAVLIDELTASTSEVFAGGLQSQHRIRVFGRTSAGAALPAHMTMLPNGDSLLHAVADFTTADGTRLEGRGVIPDEIVALSREELAAGRDAALLAAVRWLAAPQPQEHVTQPE